MSENWDTISQTEISNKLSDGGTLPPDPLRPKPPPASWNEQRHASFHANTIDNASKKLDHRPRAQNENRTARATPEKGGQI